MKKPSPMMKHVRQADKAAAAHPIAYSMLDKMVDGREYESLLSYRNEDVNLVTNEVVCGQQYNM